MKTHAIRGLLLKDWFSVRSYIARQLGLIAVIYLVLSFGLKSAAMFTSMLLLGGMMGLLSLFTVDDSCHWNAYAGILGLRPGQLVAARYIAVYGCMLLLTVISAAASVVLELFVFRPLFGTADAAENALVGIATGAAIFLFYGLMMALDIPLYYKLGVEKARIPTTLTMVVPFIAIVTTASYWGPLLDTMDLAALPWGWIFLAIAAAFAACIALSAAVSARILAKKEL